MINHQGKQTDGSHSLINKHTFLDQTLESVLKMYQRILPAAPERFSILETTDSDKNIHVGDMKACLYVFFLRAQLGNDFFFFGIRIILPERWSTSYMPITKYNSVFLLKLHAKLVKFRNLLVTLTRHFVFRKYPSRLRVEMRENRNEFND